MPAGSWDEEFRGSKRHRVSGGGQERRIFTLKGLLSRPQDLGITPLEKDIFIHPRRDPGVINEAHDFLRGYHRSYRYALAICDFQGCGKEHRFKPRRLEKDLTRKLEANGWPGRAEAIVINPELEAWVWSDSPELPPLLGWRGSKKGLGEWLYEEGLIGADSLQRKPRDPKLALEKVLKKALQPRSSSLYLQIAQKVNLDRCQDSAFNKLKTILQKWFSPKPS